MADVVKSIFMQSEYEAVYILGYVNDYTDSDGRYYKVSSRERRTIRHAQNFIRDVKIAEYDIELPLLEEDDEFFLMDEQRKVTIKSRMRSTDGSVIYYIKDKLIDTENTEKTKKECDDVVMKCTRLNEQLDVCEHEKNVVLSELETLRAEFGIYRARFKYEHKFFNF